MHEGGLPTPPPFTITSTSLLSQLSALHHQHRQLLHSDNSSALHAHVTTSFCDGGESKGCMLPLQKHLIGKSILFLHLLCVWFFLKNQNGAGDRSLPTVVGAKCLFLYVLHSVDTLIQASSIVSTFPFVYQMSVRLSRPVPFVLKCHFACSSVLRY